MENMEKSAHFSRHLFAFYKTERFRHVSPHIYKFLNSYIAKPLIKQNLTTDYIYVYISLPPCVLQSPIELPYSDTLPRSSVMWGDPC